MKTPFEKCAAELNSAFNLYAWDDSKAEAEQIARKHFEPIAAENAKLREGIACSANALTDSISCSGNDAATNMHFVRKLRALLS